MDYSWFCAQVGFWDHMGCQRRNLDQLQAPTSALQYFICEGGVVWGVERSFWAHFEGQEVVQHRKTDALDLHRG